jgi:hypothetical protein
MERKILLMIGILAVALLVALPAVRAQEAADTDAARAAMDKADPDNVDPVSIRGERWTLDITYDNPLPIVALGPSGENEVYWYMIYTITNNTGADHECVPTFLLFSDTGALVRAGVYPLVFDAIKKERSAKYKFLENAVQMVGVQNRKYRQGADNAHTGVAIFPPMDRATNKFSVFVEGLSGEYIEKPEQPQKVDPTTVEAKVLRLHKTLALSYNLPGDKWWKNLDQPVFVSKKWTWR